MHSIQYKTSSRQYERRGAPPNFLNYGGLPASRATPPPTERCRIIVASEEQREVSHLVYRLSFGPAHIDPTNFRYYFWIVL